MTKETSNIISHSVDTVTVSFTDSDSTGEKNDSSLLFATLDSMPHDSIISKIDTITKKDTITYTQLPYLSGNEPISRANHHGHDTGIMILLVISFIVVSFNFNHFRRLLSTYGQNLFTVRKRANAFDEHTTNENNVIAILIFQLCVCMGILLSEKINSFLPIPPNKIMLATCCMMGLYGIYYIFQLITYRLMGYVFTDSIGSSQWLKGFYSSHIFLGFSLLIPTFVSIFYPTTTDLMINIASALYIIARLIFINKGFKIFYNNFYSLFYFILYLCTLEIIPVIFVYDIAQLLISNLQ